MRRFDGIQPAQLGRAPVDEVRTLAPGHGVVVGGLVADVKDRLIEPLFLAQMHHQRRQELRQELIAGDHLGLARRHVFHVETRQADLTAGPAAFAVLGDESGLEQIHSPCIPEDLRPPIELRKVEAECAVGRARGLHEIATHREDILPVLGHVLRVDSEHPEELLRLRGIDAVMLLELVRGEPLGDHQVPLVGKRERIDREDQRQGSPRRAASHGDAGAVLPWPRILWNCDGPVHGLPRIFPQRAVTCIAQAVGKPSRGQADQVALADLRGVLLDEDAFHEVPADVLRGNRCCGVDLLEGAYRHGHFVQALASTNDALRRDDFVAQSEHADLCKLFFRAFCHVFEHPDSIARGEHIEGRRGGIRRDNMKAGRHGQR